MSPVSRAGKGSENLFSLWEVQGAPPPTSFREKFPQVSKSERKWNIKIENKGGATINFEGNSGEDPNQLLKGKWTFLHKSKNEESKLFESGSFDMAVPENKIFTAGKEPNLVSNIARILFCTKDDRGDLVKATTNNEGRTIYCRDVTKNWYFGFINGKHYGATFAVRPKGILRKEIQNSDINAISSLGEKSKGIIHEKLIDILKLATNNLKTFRENAKKVNNQDGDYENEEYKRQWCGNEMCFLWGTIGSKAGANEDTKNCGVSNEDFKGCNIGIIDVSRYIQENR